ncbi:uncharacterized protein EI97DRAFT_460896 [Westerdykella ornata]|uniref:F-box domain-containing protein n=1 Tax=Westerdykella ornata TaxID=318751 RepID=A0A6A6JCH9_WESOR|nr:uncharacterized protein EI97DRAFT_460896 [Westerdykella ornata]KAF2273708.1 hypothetical protein EI97DRAFT_460896 [Westerdykella ornata]
MHFNDLNNDVLQMVFDLLPQRDIKTLRLVNKALKLKLNLSIKRLFLSPNRANIDVFKAVLGHTNFREQVQEIVWDDARLEKYDDRLRKEIEEQESFVHSVLELRRKELWGDAGWLSIEESLRLYRALYDEQEAIINLQEDVATLRRGLLELPNLE